ncbi:MAG: hypothetical protein M1839_003544 [Geoglossum umbratile]|nr:MAG: hypothetical protein M1839_003544 [Geoglossum umbratile]
MLLENKLRVLWDNVRYRLVVLPIAYIHEEERAAASEVHFAKNSSQLVLSPPGLEPTSTVLFLGRVRFFSKRDRPVDSDSILDASQNFNVITKSLIKKIGYGYIKIGAGESSPVGPPFDTIGKIELECRLIKHTGTRNPSRQNHTFYVVKDARVPVIFGSTSPFNQERSGSTHKVGVIEKYKWLSNGIGFSMVQHWGSVFALLTGDYHEDEIQERETKLEASQKRQKQELERQLEAMHQREEELQKQLEAKERQEEELRKQLEALQQGNLARPAQPSPQS